jgi:hypothetical protein
LLILFSTCAISFLLVLPSSPQKAIDQSSTSDHESLTKVTSISRPCDCIKLRSFPSCTLQPIFLRAATWAPLGKLSHFTPVLSMASHYTQNKTQTPSTDFKAQHNFPYLMLQLHFMTFTSCLLPLSSEPSFTSLKTSRSF